MGFRPRLEGAPSCEVDRIEEEDGDALVTLHVDTALLPFHARIIKRQLFGENPLRFSK